jgi:hypothetical protein
MDNIPLDLSATGEPNNLAGMEVPPSVQDLSGIAASAEPAIVVPEPIVPPTASTPIVEPATAPVAASTPEPAVVFETPVAQKEIGETINEKLESAKQAMEGPERTAKREREEKAEIAGEQISDLSQKKAELNKQKETFEINWVELDNQRTDLRSKLQPILDAETEAETEEEKIELEEKSSTIPVQKAEVEKKRQEIQEKRKGWEMQKWGLQEKLTRLEEAIAENTKKYQVLLAQEDTLDQEIDSLKTDLI